MKKIVLVLIACILMLTGCSSKKKYVKEQAMVKRGYSELQEILLDPDSLVVYDCYGWRVKTKEGTTEKAQADNDKKTEDDLYAVYYHIGAENQNGETMKQVKKMTIRSKYHKR